MLLLVAWFFGGNVGGKGRKICKFFQQSHLPKLFFIKITLPRTIFLSSPITSATHLHFFSLQALQTQLALCALQTLSLPVRRGIAVRRIACLTSERDSIRLMWANFRHKHGKQLGGECVTRAPRRAFIQRPGAEAHASIVKSR